MAEFNLNTIFKKAFGYDAPESFSIPKAEARRNQSILGQPYYMEDALGREFFLPITIDGYLIPFGVLSMTWKKTIVSTPMPERGGSVHELISIDDYTFNIKGLLVNEDNEFPESGIIDLQQLFYANSNVTLRSAVSDIVLSGASDHKVIIKEIKWPGEAGVEHVQAFEIDCESDQIFELNIK